MHLSRQKALEAIHLRESNHKTESRRPTEYFASKTFTKKDMLRSISPEWVEKLWSLDPSENTKLDLEIAHQVAEAVKQWAIANGATHFTHWFQPMTGSTAEKHDSFVTLEDTCQVVEKFSASQLIQSEPDASSFPSGGMRVTFEARGYTAWDPSTPMFLMDVSGATVLCIPSVFVSYTGESLDTKTGLMRSMDSLNKASLELLKQMGDTETQYVYPTLGCEQEYFLVDREYIHRRPDLILTGRTLLGADPIHGQQLDDHYFGAIPTRVKAYMAEVETKLYELGIPAKTRHNEVAPGQFEMAPIFEPAALAADHQMLTMTVLKNVAEKHHFYCLMHEKPFAGVNGSGKHCNWALSTSGGENLLEPGKTPSSNLRFLAFLVCSLRAVHKRQVAFRAAIASHGNDHRLGANEAPPAILSVFLGSTLTEILDKLENGENLSKISAEQAYIDFGLRALPSLPKDNTDRNRTSPFAFTGNKFEFRAVGSSQSVSFPVTIINASMAEALNDFNELLKSKVSSAQSIDSALLESIREFSESSKAIRFEGDGYSQDWRVEAKKRGLKELLTTPEAFQAFSGPKEYDFLVDQKIYTKEECLSRISVRVDQYNKYLEMEVKSLMTLVRENIIPVAMKQQNDYLENLVKAEKLKLKASLFSTLKESLEDISFLISKSQMKLEELNFAYQDAKNKINSDEISGALFIKDKICPLMAELRAFCDKIEVSVSDEYWSLPKYRELLLIK